ncbi:MAG TPA: DNA polymerase IV [Tissierellia bacterium]|nr:DNA polymerase IV [Tissierellia bacterium]
MNRIIFHVDVNSAYLSWEAAHRLQQGDELDLRTIPSIIGGDPKTRKGVVLARSTPAKAFGVRTGESLKEAFDKCSSLYVAQPNHALYAECSRQLLTLFDEYTPDIQPFSIDESFLDMTHVKDPIQTAYDMQRAIWDRLGFTVNIGISVNKLLAKLASDFQKPNRVHTLFPTEIATKLWPLPIRELYMVGPASEKNFHSMGIRTIGDLAKADPEVLEAHLKSYGRMIHRYAHGIESSPIEARTPRDAKGIGNSTTLPQDISDFDTIKMYLLALSETVATRLRLIDKMAHVVTVQAKDTEFKTRTHQRKLLSPIDHTTALYQTAIELFQHFWTGYPVRLVGVQVSELVDNDQYALDIFTMDTIEQDRSLDATIDKLREKFGDSAIKRATFAGQDVKPMIGKISEEDDPPQGHEL